MELPSPDCARRACQDCKRQEYLVRFRRGAQYNIGSLYVTKRDLQDFCFTVHADPAQLADLSYQLVRNLLICRRTGLFFKGEIRIH